MPFFPGVPVSETFTERQVPTIEAVTEPFVTCGTPPDALAAEVVDEAAVHRVGRDLYVWISSEDAREATSEFFPPLDAPAARSGIDVLSERSSTAAAALAQRASEAVFERAIVAWPRAWATRLTSGVPARPRLARLQIRSDASWLVVRGGDVFVMDARGQSSAFTLAVDLQKVAGFFVSRVEESRAQESGEGGSGTCEQRNERRFLVTNPAMVEQWQLGTAPVEAALEQDARRLEQLMQVSRPCVLAESEGDWIRRTACDNYIGGGELFGFYERSLARASSAYYPETRRLAALIDTLRADLDEWEAQPISVSRAPAEPSPLEDAGADAATSDGSSANGGQDGGDATEAPSLACDAGCCLDAGDGGCWPPPSGESTSSVHWHSTRASDGGPL